MNRTPFSAPPSLDLTALDTGVVDATRITDASGLEVPTPSFDSADVPEIISPFLNPILNIAADSKALGIDLGELLGSAGSGGGLSEAEINALIAVAFSAFGLDGLSDTIITTPASGEYLRYNGSEWVNAVIDYADITGVPAITGFVDLTTGQTIGGLKNFTTNPTVNSNAIWHAGNDGSGSGLDADLLDGHDTSYFLAASDYTAADVLTKLLTVDGTGSGLDADLLDGHDTSYFLASSTYTASDILTKLLTVDGSGSGLDADLLDGLNSTSFGRLATASTWTATQTQLTTSATTLFNVGGAVDFGAEVRVRSNAAQSRKIAFYTGTTTQRFNITVNAVAETGSNAGSNINFICFDDAGTTLGSAFNITRATRVTDFLVTPTVASSTMWHAANDGSGSGLDADLLDGNNIGTSGTAVPLLSGANTWGAKQIISPGGSGGTGLVEVGSYLEISGLAPNILFTDTSAAINPWFIHYNQSALTVGEMVSSVATSRFELTTTTIKYNGNTVWHAANDGSGSGLDADIVRGVTPSANALTMLAHTFSQMRTDLTLVPGTDVQAYSAALLSIASLTTSANKGIYTTASNTYATFDLSATALTLLDDTSTSAMLTTLGALPSASYTAADVLAKLITVDGSGSGLDADLLDGLNIGTSGAAIPRLDGVNTWASATTFTSTVTFSNVPTINAANPRFQFYESDAATDYKYWEYNVNSNLLQMRILNDAYSAASTIYSITRTAHTSAIFNFGSAVTLQYNGSTIWHAANDGSGSGLDADIIRGVTPSTYGLSLIDDADASTARTTLGLGTSATVNTGTSGATIPLLNGANTWATTQTFTVAPVFTDASGSRTALGLGTAAIVNTGTSGATIPLLNAANTWATTQTFTVAPVFTDASGSRTALGLGTAAVQNTGTSGANVALMNGANTWSALQTFSFGASNSIGATVGNSQSIMDISGGDGTSVWIGSRTWGFDLRYGASNASVGVRMTSSGVLYQGAGVNLFWHAGNDGSGSGLDADLLDGLNSATAATASTVAARDSSGNLLANILLTGYATTATAAGTTTLTVASAQVQYFTGSTTQTVVLPVASTLSLGLTFTIVNNSSGVVTVQSSGLNTVLAIPAGTSADFTCILASGTSAASWNAYAYGVYNSNSSSWALITRASGFDTFVATPSGANLAALLTSALPVSKGGTNATAAGITAFNNITGYTAAGATGTTSTNLVFSTSPTLVTPVLGVATATSINGLTISTSTGVLTITNAKTFSVSNTLTLAGTDGSTLNIGAGGTLGSAAFVATGTSGATIPFLNGANTWATTQTFTVAPVFTDASGSRTALGLGTSATVNTGTSGATIPLLNGANTWATTQTFSTAPSFGALPTGAGVSSSATASTLAARDANANLLANNLLAGYATTATAAGTTTLTVTSAEFQYFTGSTTQTVTLPVASTLSLGLSFTVVNNSSGVVTVQSSGANTVLAVAAGVTAVFTCILTSGTSAASWSVSVANPYNANLVSWAAITRASGFDTFVATPSGANLASLLTTALPVSKGGTNATAAGIAAFNNITGYTAAGATGTTSTNLVFSTSPTLVTPVLGAATATSINGLTLTSSTGVLTITNAKTLTVSNTLTLTATDGSTLNVGAGGTLGSAAFVATGTSGATIPLLNGANTWSSTQNFAATVNTLTSAGAATTPLILRNASSTAATEVVLQFNAASVTTRYTEIASKNDGTNANSLIFRPSAGGSLVDALTLSSAGAASFSSTVGASGQISSTAATGFYANYQSAAQGGTIALNKGASGTTLAGSVNIDINANLMRIYENGGSFRGVYIDITTCGSQSLLWHAANDGSGSGLDADLLDGLNSTAFAQLASNPTFNAGASNTTVSAVGTSGYGMFYAQGSGTNSAYLVFANVTNSERSRIYGDNSRNLIMSNDSGTTAHFTMASTGAVTLTSTLTATNVTATSDKNLKYKVENITDNLLALLRPVSFLWKKDDTKSIGFIAQEMELVVPEVVLTNEDTGIKSINYGALTSLLVAGWQDQQKLIEDQDARIAKLEAIVQKLLNDSTS